MGRSKRHHIRRIIAQCSQGIYEDDDEDDDVVVVMMKKMMIVKTCKQTSKSVHIVATLDEYQRVSNMKCLGGGGRSCTRRI